MAVRAKNAEMNSIVGNLSGNATSATTATQDTKGQAITSYIRALSISGRTITYTRGDGTTGTITTQDTDTNTHYTTHLYAGTLTGSANATTTNGNTYLILTDDTTVRDRINVTGEGKTTVVSDANGKITIKSTWRGIQDNLTSTSTTDSLSANQGKVLKEMIDTKIANLVNGAPETLDTLGEIATALKNNAGVVDAINESIATKANASDLTSHTGNTSNPHKVTPGQIGLGNVDNTADASKNVLSATKLYTARAIDGVSFNGTAAITHYGTCSTAAGTAAKTVSLTGFTLVTGARIAVKFTVTNSAASPTLNVNSTGAKSIMYRGSAISAGYLAANRVYEFVYDGTNYELIGDINTNTTYSAGTGLSLSGTTFNHSNSVTAATAQGDASKTLTFGGTFTIPTVTYDAQGHITAKGTTTMTMPANPNTDWRVSQTVTTTSNYRPLIMGITESADPTALASTKTDVVLVNTNLYAQPSSGTIFAKAYKVAEKVNLQYNSNDECLDFVFG